jgi:hypothetical protein
VHLLGAFFRRRTVRAETGGGAQGLDHALPRPISAATTRKR